MAANIFNPKYDGTRTVMVILFVLWGLGGFLLAVITVSGASALASAVMATAGGILWIGGMVFFGMSALLAAPSYVMTNVLKTGNYKGYPYRAMVDGRIEVKANEQWLSYDNWMDLKKDIKDRQI